MGDPDLTPDVQLVIGIHVSNLFQARQCFESRLCTYDTGTSSTRFFNPIDLFFSINPIDILVHILRDLCREVF